MKPTTTNRRSFFTKLALATGAATLFPRLANAAPSMGNGTLTGTTTIAPGGTLLIPSGATIQAEPGANILGWPTGGGGGGEIPTDIQAQLDALTPRYALFEIPLGIDAGGTLFTDFELKGTVNNFTGSPDTVYFYGSQYGGADSSHSQTGITYDVFYTDNLDGTNHSASRQWRTQNATQSIFEQKFSGTSRIGGAVVVVPMGKAGYTGIYNNQHIRPDNTLLRFVYQRVSPSAMEGCWVPITPKWVRYNPTPAMPSVGIAMTPGYNNSETHFIDFNRPQSNPWGTAYFTFTTNAAPSLHWISLTHDHGIDLGSFQGRGTFTVPVPSLFGFNSIELTKSWADGATPPFVSKVRIGTYPGGDDLGGAVATF